MTIRGLQENLALEAPEPPRKRLRLSGHTWKSADDIPPWVNSILETCLVDQVFPHIDAEISKLPCDTVDGHKLATEVRISNSRPGLSSTC